MLQHTQPQTCTVLFLMSFGCQFSYYKCVYKAVTRQLMLMSCQFQDYRFKFTVGKLPLDTSTLFLLLVHFPFLIPQFQPLDFFPFFLFFDSPLYFFPLIRHPATILHNSRFIHLLHLLTSLTCSLANTILPSSVQFFRDFCQNSLCFVISSLNTEDNFHFISFSASC